MLAHEIGVDPLSWWHNCHAASLQVVRSGLYPMSRVARGRAKGVSSQHSWVVQGDPYEPTRIIDPSMWSYVKGALPEVSKADFRKYVPHGSGSIWEHGRPPTAEESLEKPVELTPEFELSELARSFLAVLGPLGRRGWSVLASSPVGGWPASEIIAAIDDTPELSVLVPVDILGMLTDRNPNHLYF